MSARVDAEGLMILVEISIGVFLTATAVWLRQRSWPRRIAVVYLMLDMVLGAAFGLSNVARFGLRSDTLQTTSPLDAYRDGLLSAQDVANRYIPMVLVLAFCLALLAWFPMKKHGERS